MITRSGFCCCGGLRLRLGSAIENEHQRGFAAALAFDSRILGPKHSNCQRDDFFYPKRVSYGSYLRASPEHHRASLDSWRRIWNWKRAPSDKLRG